MTVSVTSSLDMLTMLVLLVVAIVVFASALKTTKKFWFFIVGLVFFAAGIAIEITGIPGWTQGGITWAHSILQILAVLLFLVGAICMRSHFCDSLTTKASKRR